MIVVLLLILMCMLIYVLSLTNEETRHYINCFNRSLDESKDYKNLLKKIFDGQMSDTICIDKSLYEYNGTKCLTRSDVYSTLGDIYTLNSILTDEYIDVIIQDTISDIDDIQKYAYGRFFMEMGIFPFFVIKIWLVDSSNLTRRQKSDLSIDYEYIIKRAFCDKLELDIMNAIFSIDVVVIDDKKIIIDDRPSQYEENSDNVNYLPSGIILKNSH